MGDADDSPSFNLVLYDENQKQVASVEKATKLSGEMLVENPNLWWPYLSKNEERYAYLYTLEVNGRI